MNKVYCYSDTSILINRLDIHDKEKFAKELVSYEG